jgi:hypothetical protein
LQLIQDFITFFGPLVTQWQKILEDNGWSETTVLWALALASIVGFLSLREFLSWYLRVYSLRHEMKNMSEEMSGLRIEIRNLTEKILENSPQSGTSEREAGPTTISEIKPNLPTDNRVKSSILESHPGLISSPASTAFPLQY